MRLRDTVELYGYGTSEGAVKGWDTRGRGVHKATPQDMQQVKKDFINDYKKIDKWLMKDDGESPEVERALEKRFGEFWGEPVEKFSEGFNRAKQIAKEGGDVRVYHNDQGKVLGAMQVEDRGDHLYVPNIVTHSHVLMQEPGYTNEKGIGTAMMNHVFDEARSQNKDVKLSPEYSVTGFYKKLGMEELPGGDMIKRLRK